ncbi:MAG: tetratricopeptide repeat protein [Anaerolineae bacterium]
MSPPLLLALLGLLYVLVFGGLMLLRQEGISARFAVEACVLIAAVVGLAAWTGYALNPAIFLLLLHVVVMRVRLLVDLGNLLARRGKLEAADRVYRLAGRLWPDEAGRLIVRMNQGVLAIQRGEPDAAIAALRAVLAAAPGGFLGPRHESACHYNLAVALLKKGLEAQAVVEFNAVLETWPASEYARYASIALERRKRKGAVHE